MNVRGGSQSLNAKRMRRAKQRRKPYCSSLNPLLSSSLSLSFAPFLAISSVVGSKKLTSTTLTRRQKQVISSATGQPVQSINESISSFSRMRHMHGWLRGRRERGMPMPTSQEDAQRLMQKDLQAGRVDMEVSFFNNTIQQHTHTTHDTRRTTHDAQHTGGATTSPTP